MERRTALEDFTISKFTRLDHTKGYLVKYHTIGHLCTSFDIFRTEGEYLSEDVEVNTEQRTWPGSSIPSPTQA